MNVSSIGFDPFSSPHDLVLDDEVGAFWDDAAKAVKGAAKAAVDFGTQNVNPMAAYRTAKRSVNVVAKVAGNKYVASGLAAGAIIFPPAAPAAGAVIAAGQVAKKLQSAIPADRKQAEQIVKRTAALAMKGDVGAKRGLALIDEAKRRRSVVNAGLVAQGKAAGTGYAAAMKARARQEAAKRAAMRTAQRAASAVARKKVEAATKTREAASGILVGPTGLAVSGRWVKVA